MRKNQQQNSGLTHAIGAGLVSVCGLLARQADDVARIGFRNVDDLSRIGMNSIDDVARPAVFVSDDVWPAVNNISISESRIASGKYRHIHPSVKTQESIGNDLPMRLVHKGVEITVKSPSDEDSNN